MTLMHATILHVPSVNEHIKMNLIMCEYDLWTFGIMNKDKDNCSHLF